MGNKQLNELNQIVTIETGDQMLIDDISEAEGAVSKYATIKQFDDRYKVFAPSVTPYAEMFQNNNAVETIISITGTYYQVVNYSSGLLNAMSFNLSKLLASIAGIYLLNITISAVCGENRSFEFAVFKNGIEDTKLHASRFFEKDKEGSTSITGFISISVDDEVEIRVQNTQDSENITIISSNFNMHGI